MVSVSAQLLARVCDSSMHVTYLYWPSKTYRCYNIGQAVDCLLQSSGQCCAVTTTTDFAVGQLRHKRLYTYDQAAAGDQAAAPEASHALLTPSVNCRSREIFRIFMII